MPNAEQHLWEQGVRSTGDAAQPRQWVHALLRWRRPLTSAVAVAVRPCALLRSQALGSTVATDTVTRREVAEALREREERAARGWLATLERQAGRLEQLAAEQEDLKHQKVRAFVCVCVHVCARMPV